MKINGLNEFFSRIASLARLAVGVQKGMLLPILSPLQMFKTDTMLFSDMGKKLSFGVEKAPLLNGSQEAAVSDPVLIATEKYLTKTETILTRMHELATTAQDEKLSNLDRINMQIEMEELRAELQTVWFDYKAKIEGTISYAEMTRKIEYSNAPLIASEKNGHYAWLRGDGTSMLERARDRILRGEEWNVREAFVPHGIRNKEPEAEFTIANAGFGELKPLPEPLIEGGRWAVIDDESIVNASHIPTVREQLERNNGIILMDAKSAADGVMRVEGEIEAAQKLRDKYTQAVNSYHQAKASGDTIDTKGFGKMVIAALGIIAYGHDPLNPANTVQGKLTNVSSIYPTAPEFFYFDETERSGIPIPARIVHSDNVRKYGSLEDYARGLVGEMIIDGRIENLHKRPESYVMRDISMITETPKPKPPIPVGVKLDIVA